MKSKSIVAFVATLFLVGCATRGTGFVPVVDLKASAKTEEQFRTDLQECQTLAGKGPDVAQSAVVGAVALAILGAILAPRSIRGNIAGHGALMGGVSGTSLAVANQETAIRVCLAGRGYNVLG